MEETFNRKDLNPLKLTNNKKKNLKTTKQYTIDRQITQIETQRQSKNRTERYTYDNKKLINSIDKQNLQHIIRKGNQCVQLPMLKKTLPIKANNGEQSIEINPILFKSALYTKRQDQDFEGSHIKWEQSPKINSLNKSLIQGSLSNYKQNLSQRKQYMDKLNIIRLKGIQLQKSTNGVLKQANYAERVINKKYGALQQNSNSILTGVQDYLLEEQRTRKYKREILDMWMKYDK